MKTDIARRLAMHFNMTPMETENVLYSQTWCAKGTGSDGRPHGTAIVALLTDAADSFSDLHSLPTDEVWHFYGGDPIELLLLHPNGQDEVRLLGSDILDGKQHVQTVVPAGCVMGARLLPGGSYGLYGNTMAPGYVLSDFEPADIPSLMARHPARNELIRALTRQPEK